MVSYEIKFESNKDIALKDLQEKSNKILYAMGVSGVDGAVESISGENLAVDTGRLRASISFVTANGQSGGSGVSAGAVSKSGDKLSGSAPALSVIIGSNVEYASYVETGTSKMGARPFLRDGIMNKRDEIQEITQGILSGEY